MPGIGFYLAGHTYFVSRQIKFRIGIPNHLKSGQDKLIDPYLPGCQALFFVFNAHPVHSATGHPFEGERSRHGAERVGDQVERAHFFTLSINQDGLDGGPFGAERILVSA